MAAGWFYSPTQIIEYLATRVSSLKPPKVGSNGASNGSNNVNTNHSSLLEQAEKSNCHSARADLTPMAYVCGGLSGVDMGFVRLFYRVSDNH